VKNGLAGAFRRTCQRRVYVGEPKSLLKSLLQTEAICRSISWVSRKDVGSIVEKIGKLARERGTQK
jgi:hypothetical protein